MALDFDHCIRAGSSTPEVEAIALTSYAEYSPAARACACCCAARCSIRKDHGEPFGFETFSSKGFVTFTGNRLFPDFARTIWPASAPRSRRWSKALHQRRRARRCQPHRRGARPQPERDRASPGQDRPDRGHDDWLHVGMALHHETRGDGFEYWDSGAAPAASTRARCLWRRWDSFGRSNDQTITARTLLKAAGITAGGVASPDEFDAIVSEAKEQQAEKPLRFPFVPASQFSSTTGLPWIIKGVLPRPPGGAVRCQRLGQELRGARHGHVHRAGPGLARPAHQGRPSGLYRCGRR